MMTMPLNDKGFHEIRIDGIGGQGGNFLGKFLAHLAFKHYSLGVSQFSSYGSEKKGSSVQSYIRFTTHKHPIFLNYPIGNPHLWILLSDSFLPKILLDSQEDLNPTILVNTRFNHAEALTQMHSWNHNVNLGILNATDDAYAIEVKVNMVMLGAIAKICSFFSKDSFLETIKVQLKQRYSHLIERSLEGFEVGYRNLNLQSYSEHKNDLPHPEKIGLQDQIQGGILNPANALSRNHSFSRYGQIPVFNDRRCIHCGQCYVVCPDQCIVWKEVEDQRVGRKVMKMVGIDYDYCKGCLKCVEICPVSSLTAGLEKDFDVQAFQVDVNEKVALKGDPTKGRQL